MNEYQNELYELTESAGFISDWGCNYCCDCGQALYWGDNQ